MVYSFTNFLTKNSFSVLATVKKDAYSSADALRGKAERRAKKTLYEYITGCDFGETDVDDADCTVISSSKAKATVVDVNSVITDNIKQNEKSSEKPIEKEFEKQEKTLNL